MSNFAEARGTNPVTAMPSVLGGLAVNALAQANPKSISADSFRRLTALLKKPDTIPSLKPILPAVALPPVAPHLPAPPAILPELAQIIVAPMVLQLPTPPPILPAPALVGVAPVAIVIVEPEIVEVVEFAAKAPPPFEVPTLQTILQPDVPRPRQAMLRSTSREDESQIQTIAPVRVPGPVVEQTPAQEQESAELARSLLDMMSASNSNGLPQERALAADTLLRLVPKLPLKSLLMLAERLCMMESPPQLIVAKLICDPRIEVAGPLLEECSHITDEVLITVINEGLPAKRRMMARRRKISRAVAAKLVLTGDPSVLLTLCRNANAEIPHESFIELVNFAGKQTDLLAPLCTRADLPVPFAFELFWSAPAQLRRYLLSRFLTDSETLTKILKIALVGNSDESSENIFPDPDLIKAALALAADGKIDEASAAIAECAQIDAATAERILTDRQGDPLAALFKAVGVPRVIAGEMLAHAATTILDPTRDPEELPSLFGSLSFNKARILLTYWDWATLQSGPYAPLN